MIAEKMNRGGEGHYGFAVQRTTVVKSRQASGSVASAGGLPIGTMADKLALPGKTVVNLVTSGQTRTLTAKSYANSVA
jgi:hypothetical protein